MKIINSNSILLFLLVPIIGFGQLSVRNSAYVYVTNEVVFVTDDVNIEETTANIYLRDEAQLIQGSGTTGNSGIGKLSVYQKGTVNEYAYNYWCSPVGNVGANDNTNRAIVPNQQFYDVNTAPITSTLATFTSAYNGSSNPLVISSAWLYSYNPGTVYNQWDYVGESGNVASGYGFTMKGTSGSGDNQLYDFRGKPNNGDIQVNVVADQFTLVGNPYPSALDAVDFIHDTTNKTLMTGNLYYWEQAPAASSHFLEAYIGGYATYTISSDGVTETFVPATFKTYNGDGTINNTSAGNGTKAAKRYIPIGQGFMILGQAGIAASNLTFKNSQRTYYKQSGAESYFFRGTNTNTSSNNTETTQYNNFGSIVTNEYKRFRLNVDFNNLYTRQMVMNFHDSATDGFDYGLEGRSPGLLSSDAHWTIDDMPYVIQALKFDTTITIPLTVISEDSQPINFRIVDIQNFDANQPIYIHDIETNEYANLRDGVYSINLPTGTYTDKYEITFTNDSVLALEDNTFENFTVYQNNNDAVLTINNPNGLDIDSVSLFDILGKQAFNKTKLETNSRYTFSTKNLSDGVYIAKVTDVNSKVFTKKIIVANIK